MPWRQAAGLRRWRSACTCPSGTAALLDACVAMGLLEKTGDTYRNTPASDRYLTCRSPESLRRNAGVAGRHLSDVDPSF